MTDLAQASLWGIFELALNGPKEGNPFRDVELTATFKQAEKLVRVTGFYDGDGVFRLRFMPEALGQWAYKTASNVAALNGVSGTVEVGPAKEGNHGPVRAVGEHFRYADGTRYINIGTTAYVWNLQGDALEEETLATLAAAPFTKIRMCVFPKHYRYNENEPALYPFKLLDKGTSAWGGNFRGESGWKFDFDRFEPAYFQHLEKRIADLNAIGVEADLILLHPYDRWGFARMSPDEDDRYLRYVVSRLAAFPNVWWSMANEYDLMPQKPLDAWDRYIRIVADTDPHGHLLGVHNCFAFYDHTHPLLTHASIQRPETSRSAYWRKTYGKPVSLDEVCYEGDIAEAWGNISGQELVHRFWDATVNGGYATHGEAFRNKTDTIFWAKGGALVGESVARIAFLKRILEEGPDEGIDPIVSTNPYRIMAGGGMDNVALGTLFTPAAGEEDWSRVMQWFATGGQAHRYYLTYFGQSQPSEVAAAVPPGERYSATILDTWAMTRTPIADSVSRGDLLHFAPKPFQALLLQRIDA